jgi:hypothetical protein
VLTIGINFSDEGIYLLLPVSSAETAEGNFNKSLISKCATWPIHAGSALYNTVSGTYLPAPRSDPMLNFSRLCRCSLLCLTLAAGTAPAFAQENTEKRPVEKVEKKGQPHEHNQGQQHERRDEPRKEAPAQVQHSAPPPQPHPDNQPQRQVQRQQSPAQVYQRPVQENRPQQQSNGRTFGNPPNRGNSPDSGRTFGNQPGARPADAPRGPAMNTPRPMPQQRTYTTRTGDVIHRDVAGRVTQVRMSNGTTVFHPQNAPRRVEVVRPGGVVVASAPGRGYVQRTVVVQNTTIIKRTYIYNGVPQAQIYRPHVWGGITLAVYTPVRYYRPAFYVYAYHPWSAPVIYSWGWAGRPWYVYYGPYFSPYPTYASPALWLTDYMIAAMLQEAYEERMAARMAAANAYADSAQTPMSPQVKQAIADEVRRQIDQERAQGQMANSGGQDPLFGGDGTHIFVAHSPLNVNSNYGGCWVGEGDVLQMNGTPAPNSQSADLMVISSRGSDCRTGSMVSVQLQDLQEMQNQMRATIDRGLSDLQSRQGQGGLPVLPQGSAGTIDTPLTQQAQPDTDVAREVASANQEADRADQTVAQNPDAGPPTLSLGMDLDQVKAIQGDPEKIVDLGAKKIYVYRDLKITFTDGKVSDIQ